MPKLSSEKLQELRLNAKRMLTLVFIRDELLSLLDEVETGRRTVEVQDRHRGDGYWNCPECKAAAVHTFDKHCSNCGVQLAWKDSPYA